MVRVIEPFGQFFIAVMWISFGLVDLVSYFLLWWWVMRLESFEILNIGGRDALKPVDKGE